MTATPKHRLRATVTYTVEYDPSALFDIDPALSVNELANMEQEALRAGLFDIQDLGADRTVKVEVIR